MNGSLLALVSALFFAASNICTRRGVVRIEDAALGGYISVFVAPPLFLAVALLTGDVGSIASFTWKGYFWLAISGIIHFVLGRSANFWSVRHLGANMASVFMSLSLLYPVALGFLVLGEAITTRVIFGSVLIIIGPALLAWPQNRGGPGPVGSGADARLSGKGVLAALLAGMFYGVTPVSIKWGLAEGGTPLAGTFVSYAAASLIFGGAMFGEERRKSIVFMERQALFWFVLSGVCVGTAQLFRYTALARIPISIAGPLVATGPVFMLGLSFAVNRRLESFRWNVIVGAILVVLGTVFVYR